jgi:hypothetical protein
MTRKSWRVAAGAEKQDSFEKKGKRAGLRCFCALAIWRIKRATKAQMLKQARDERATSVDVPWPRKKQGKWLALTASEE